MKKFTIKDFILYNGPCFSCGKKVTIKVFYSYSNDEFPDFSIPTSLNVNKDIIDIRLKIKYSFSLDLQLSISDNKFQVSNMKHFIAYLGNRDIHLISECSKCKNNIISNPLQFDCRGFVKPLSLLREDFTIKDNNVNYMLYTEFSENSTVLKVADNNKISTINLPLLPLYKFKNKEKILNKLKTYILFL